jgi:transposase-like protein
MGAKQEAAVMALLSSKNVEEAARVASVTPRTLYRWMNEPEFDAAYRAARRQAYGQSISRLQQGSTAAATTLLKVMVDVATPPSTRVRAAEAVLSHAAKAIEIEDLDARLKELEMAVEANKGGRR